MARFRPWKETPRIFSSSAATFFRRSMVRGSVGADRISCLLTTLVLAIVPPVGSFALGRSFGVGSFAYGLPVLTDYRLISGVTKRTCHRLRTADNRLPTTD